MTARTSESGSNCLGDWSVLVIGNSMPPRDPNDDDDDDEEDEGGPNQMKMSPRSSENPTNKKIPQRSRGAAGQGADERRGAAERRQRRAATGTPWEA
jgi:hypothetical protein